MLGLVKEATAKAREAQDVALQIKDGLQSDLSAQLKSVSHKLDHFEENYAPLPLKWNNQEEFYYCQVKIFRVERSL